MILYNTLIGVTAGAALVLVPILGAKLRRGHRVEPEGWALSFGVLGIILTFLSGMMTVTWPLHAKPQVNIIFGEPTLFLGVLLLAAALFMWTHPEAFRDRSDVALDRLTGVLRPVSWLVFSLGLILLACTVAVFRFSAIGAAPAQEPISGIFHDYPWVENTLVGSLYALSAVGPLLAPVAVRDLGSPVARMGGWCLVVSGVAILLYSALNYYTHIGLLVNAG
ncbi:DUF981 domain-containing protein [Candidatus Binatia bacterium]|nr:DUF981 domain-containing protein [Candidatus Binatia bacterium]